MKKSCVLILPLMLILLLACKEEEVKEIVFAECQRSFTLTVGDVIPIETIEIPFSETKGNLDNFINYCKPVDINPIYFLESTLRTHQMVLSFDGIYPISAIEWVSYDGQKANNIQNVSIDYSLNGISYNRYKSNYGLTKGKNIISLNGLMAKSIRFTFSDDELEYGIRDIRFKLAEGVIVMEDHDWSNTFLRYDGWTGADGIFSFNLTDGDVRVGSKPSTTGFIFSDTFVGEVYPHNMLRKSGIIINNSLGYLSHEFHTFTFDYPVVDGNPKSAFEPNPYIGFKARNLMDGDGLSVSHHYDGLLTNCNEGTMWLTDQNNPELLIDFSTEQTIQSLYLWNYNATPGYGIESFSLSYSLDGISFSLIDSYVLNQASGGKEEPFSLALEFSDVSAKYLKISNVAGFNNEFIGLGKIMIFNQDEDYLFGEVIASSAIDTLHPNEESARLWLQDGVVIGNYLYVFPILIKDYLDFFKVHSVTMIKIPIIDERLDYQNTTYNNSPLQVATKDGGTIFYGAGIMNNVDIDGYIYIYGYKDLDGRWLVVGRFLPKDIQNFNEWEYFDGGGWSKDINDSYPIIDKVSAELSVTYLETGVFADKYMLVVMENTTSGTISYALSDTPYGPFSDYVKLYQTPEGSYLRGAFTYNAKMHPHLSEPGNYLISYNVNTLNMGALSDARIYYPRFIRVIEVKNRED